MAGIRKGYSALIYNIDTIFRAIILTFTETYFFCENVYFETMTHHSRYGINEFIVTLLTPCMLKYAVNEDIDKLSCCVGPKYI